MEYADCEHCSRRICRLDNGRWRHDIPTFTGSVGCRAASFNSDTGWDDSLLPGWKAKPKRGTERKGPGIKDGAGREVTVEQAKTWIISQAIRNRLEMFHGGGAIDPENPDSDEGFITDKQMGALNIVIRYTVDEALAMFDQLPGEKADSYCSWQLATVSGYMEPPGTPELRRAYVEVSGDDEPELKDAPWPPQI